MCDIEDFANNNYNEHSLFIYAPSQGIKHKIIMFAIVNNVCYTPVINNKWDTQIKICCEKCGHKFCMFSKDLRIDEDNGCIYYYYTECPLCDFFNGGINLLTRENSTSKFYICCNSILLHKNKNDLKLKKIKTCYKNKIKKS